MHCRPDPWKADPANLGNDGMPGMFGVSEDAFWLPLNTHDFWAGLEPTKEFQGIVTYLSASSALRGHELHLLTKPSKHQWCLSGKHAWIRRHMPRMNRLTTFTSMKHLLAGPGRILIDDRTDNCKDWEGAGGKSLLFPRPWNTRYREQEGFDFEAEVEELLR